MLISKTLRLFLDSIGRREEYEFYLRKFQSARATCFALVCPDSASVEESGDLMTFDLQFLRQLDLMPLLVLADTDAGTDWDGLSVQPLYHRVHLDTLDAGLAHCVQNRLVPVLVEPALPLLDLVGLLTPRVARRLHLLRARGMLRDSLGHEVFYHYTRRSNLHTLAENEAPMLALAETWLRSDPGLHISIASPLHLLQEIFTVRGMGTIVRPGSILHHYTHPGQVDLARLETLFTEAFGRTLRDTAILQRVCDFHIEQDYRGAALLEPHASGKYLSKFAVGTQARGEGLAQELWESACAPQPRLFWRSRRDNPINHWYERQSDGRHSEGDWSVFWKGVAATDLPAILHFCLQRPPDFLPPPTTPS